MRRKGDSRWAFHGSKFDGMRDAVHKMTRASLKEKNISAKPGSKEYETEFNRLVEVYYEQKREEAKRRSQADAEWKAAHQGDSDEELLAYVRSAVRENVQYTKPSRVVGGRYIAERFGGWLVAIELAGLEMPEGYKPAAAEDVEAYLRKRGEADGESKAVLDAPKEMSVSKTPADQPHRSSQTEAGMIT